VSSVADVIEYRGFDRVLCDSEIAVAVWRIFKYLFIRTVHIISYHDDIYL
jgi:hypothetical protein